MARKPFGMFLILALALGGLTAEGASATPITVEGVATAYLTGDQESQHSFATAEGFAKCTTASFSAKSTEAAHINELTVVPSYQGCSAYGFATADIKTNGCTYTFTTPTSVGAGLVTWSGSSWHIVCPAGKSIEITPTSFGVSVCTQFWGAQTPEGGHVRGKNVAGSNPMDLTLEFGLQQLHYTGTGSVCTGPTNELTGTYNGNSTFRCYSNEAHTIPVHCTIS